MEEKLENNLYNNIETFHHIKCTKCKKEVYEVGGDDWQVVETFFKQGWYATENNCYCPECQIKRKRN